MQANEVEKELFQLGPPVIFIMFKIIVICKQETLNLKQGIYWTFKLIIFLILVKKVLNYNLNELLKTFVTGFWIKDNINLNNNVRLQTSL